MKSINKIFFVFILLMATIPHFLNAQDTGISALIEQALEAGIEQSQLDVLRSRAAEQGFGDRELIEIVKPAVQLAEQNLPFQSALQKALEGLSKGETHSRMRPVLQKIRQKTERAGTIVSDWLSKDEGAQLDARLGSPKEFRQNLTISIARSLMQDIPEDRVEALLRDMGRPDVVRHTTSSGIVAAVGIFADLPTSIDQPEASRAFLVRALKSGFGASELQRLSTALRVAHRRNRLPAAGILEIVSGKIPAYTLVGQRFQSLFNGMMGGGLPGAIPPIGLEIKPGIANAHE